MPYVELALDNRLMYSFDPSYLGQVPTRLSVARMTARALDFTDISILRPVASPGGNLTHWKIF